MGSSPIWTAIYCRCSLMVEHNLAKVDTGVRFSSSAPLINKHLRVFFLYKNTGTRSKSFTAYLSILSKSKCVYDSAPLKGTFINISEVRHTPSY